MEGEMGVGGDQGWKTPLPYLFGGLAAMFFLISMSLLFLVCSYVRRTNRLERDVEEASAGRIRERSERGRGGGVVNSLNCKIEKKFVVIMPGDENPTCLATPRCYTVFHSVDDEKKLATTTMHQQISETQSTDVV